MVDNHAKPSRVLPFPLKEPTAMSHDVVAGSITLQTVDTVFPVDPDEVVQICLNLSLNEYVTLASAIDVGSDIAYGNERNAVWWIWVRALAEACGMTCADVADCIETDADVLAALLSQLSANGYVPSSETAVAAELPEISAAQQASEMLPNGYDCSNPAQDMAIARAIVRELHENFIDLLEQIELSTNAVEAANIASDGVPIFGTLNNLTELADWYIETIAETYQASYTQNVEDELSCAIFCLLQAGCTITLNNLLETYGTFAVANPDLSNFQNFITWMITESIAAGTTMVATMHFSILILFRFGGSIFGDGFNDLQNTIRSAAEWRDYSYEDCEDCPPAVVTKNYWRIYYDFGLSDWSWQVDTNNSQYVPGAGFETLVGHASPISTLIQIPDIGLDSLGGVWIVKVFANEQWSVDQQNSGANDFTNQSMWSGANFTGTLQTFGNATLGTIAWRPPGYRGANVGAANPQGRSFRVTRQVAGGAANRDTYFIRITRVVIIGVPDGAGQKPGQAAWWRDTLPATLAEMFED